MDTAKVTRMASLNGRWYAIISNAHTTNVYRLKPNRDIDMTALVASEPGGTAADMQSRHALYEALVYAGTYD